MVALLSALVGLYVHHLKDLAPIRELDRSPPENPRVARPVHPNSSPLCDVGKKRSYSFIGSGLGSVDSDLLLAVSGNYKHSM